MQVCRQEYWSGLPRHPPGGLPDPGIELHISCVSRTAGGFFTAESLGKPLENVHPSQKVFFFFHCLLFHSGQCKLFILDALAYLHKGRSYEGLDSVLKLMKAAPCSQALESESHLVLSDSLRPHGLHSPWNSPGQNTGVGGLSLHQGIFPTQELNPGLQHRRRTLPAEPQGSPKEALGDSNGFSLSITPFP